jgi:hypothetical protein
MLVDVVGVAVRVPLAGATLLDVLAMLVVVVTGEPWIDGAVTDEQTVATKPELVALASSMVNGNGWAVLTVRVTYCEGCGPGPHTPKLTDGELNSIEGINVFIPF